MFRQVVLIWPVCRSGQTLQFVCFTVETAVFFLEANSLEGFGRVLIADFELVVELGLIAGFELWCLLVL